MLEYCWNDGHKQPVAGICCIKIRRGMGMDLKMSALILGGICILVLAIGVLRRRAEIILNFLVRTVLGVLAIYIGNAVLMGVGIEQAVGMNAISVLTVGSLGTGGFALLYGILFYNML